MTANQREAFMEVTKLVADSTNTFAKIAKLCAQQTEDIQVRLAKAKALLDEEEPTTRKGR